MVKDHSDGEKGNPLPPYGLLVLISSNVLFYMHHPTDRFSTRPFFYTSRGVLAISRCEDTTISLTTNNSQNLLIHSPRQTVQMVEVCLDQRA